MSFADNAPSCDTDVISFVGKYKQPEIQQRYERLASITMRECEGILRSLRIKGVVTCRTKTPESLEKKLKSMSMEVEFRDWVAKHRDIAKHNEMGDLAGVRIGLYLPGDVITIGKEIQNRFEQKHLFGTVTGGRNVTQNRNLDIDCHGNGLWMSRDDDGFDEFWEYSGYRSWQIVVAWKTALNEGLNHLNVEIQLGTVVTQAWAEVQHNIIYKRPTDILATPTMKRIIDAINGLAINTEIMLKELERGYEQARKEAEARDRKPLSPPSKIQEWFHKTYVARMPEREREGWSFASGSAHEFDTLWQNTYLPRRMGTVHKAVLCPYNLRKLIETLGILQHRTEDGHLDFCVMILGALGYTPGQETLGPTFQRLVVEQGLLTTASDKRYNLCLFNSGSNLI
jgi:ppGpp synthetase/RelA/SpoT-type nucleotidyltranferase